MRPRPVAHWIYQRLFDVLTISRFMNHSEIGTFGHLYHASRRLCYTVEAPWFDNMPFKSCVGAGLYRLVKRNGAVYLHNPALNVDGIKRIASPPMRYACLFHAGNHASELHGCIAPGMDLQILDGILAVKESRKALRKIQTLLSEQDWLTIKWFDV